MVSKGTASKRKRIRAYVKISEYTESFINIRMRYTRGQNNINLQCQIFTMLISYKTNKLVAILVEYCNALYYITVLVSVLGAFECTAAG